MKVKAKEEAAPASAVINIHFTVESSVAEVAKRKGFASASALARFALRQYLDRYPDKRLVKHQGARKGEDRKTLGVGE